MVAFVRKFTLANSPDRPRVMSGGDPLTNRDTPRALSADEILRHRLLERDLEFEARQAALRAAANGEGPTSFGEVPANGAKAFVESLDGVDVDTVIEAMAVVHHQGYVIVHDVLTSDIVSRVRDGMAGCFEATRALFEQPGPQNDRQTRHIQNVLSKTSAADQVAENPFFRALLAGILGFDYVLNAGAVAMSPDPGCAPQGLHRDDGFYALIPRPHMPLVVTAAFALDDFTAENGGTQLVPGSVRWPESRMPEPSEVVHAAMPAGSMLLWDGALFHGGGGNTTTNTRRTLTLNYTRGWLRTQFNQYLSVPRSRVLSMSPALQKDLGYHRSAFGLGGCDMQDPLEYLKRLAASGGDGAQRELGAETSLPRRDENTR